VAPAELEALLVSHTAVQDAAVVSKLDERRGELPTAFVVLKPQQSATEEELHHYIAGIPDLPAQFVTIVVVAIIIIIFSPSGTPTEGKKIIIILIIIRFRAL